VEGTLRLLVLVFAGGVLSAQETAKTESALLEEALDIDVDGTDDEILRELAAKWRTGREKIERTFPQTSNEGTPQETKPRKAEIEQVRGVLVRQVSAAVDDAVRGPTLVAEAIALDYERRKQHHFENFICDCPNEDWSRTLAACWEPCREGQRSAVRQWLEEHFSDEEIVEKMIEKSGPRVVHKARTWLSNAIPYAILAVGIGFVGFIFVGLRGRSQRRQSSGAVEASEGPDESSESKSRDEEPDALDQRLEEELRKLED